MNRRADTPWHRWWNPLSVPSGAVPEPPRPLAPARASKEETNAVGQVGNDIIAAFGFDPGAGDTLTTRIDDIASDTWITGTDGPLPGRSEGAAVTHDGSLYAVGGRAGSVLPNLDRYTPATDTWASLAPMPTARAGLAVARVDEAIYAIGGRTSPGGPCTGGELATVERFDIASDTWTTVAPLPSARSDLAAKTKGDKIYVFAGCAGGASLGNVDVYDPNTDAWSTAPADLPTPRAAMYAVGKKGGTIFVIGGYAGGAALGVNEAYKVSKDTWSTWARMITPRASSPTAGGSTRSAGRCRRSETPPTRTRSSSPRRPESAGLSPRHPQSEGDPVDLRPE